MPNDGAGASSVVSGDRASPGGVGFWNPPRVTLVAGGFYLAFTLAALALHGWNPLWFVWIGEKFANHDPHGRTGYDGQFVYYIARYGAAAETFLDNPSYRFRRILMPVVAAVLSGAEPVLIPWAIVLIGFASVVTTTWVLARWLEAKGARAAYAFGYPLYVGIFLAYSRGLTEPLAFALATPGAIAWIEGRRGRAWGLLAAAALAKEIALLFVLGLAVAEAVRGRWRGALAGFSTALPLLFWEAFLTARFHSAGAPLVTGGRLSPVPLAGIVPHLTAEPGRISAFLFVALPAAALLVLSARLVRRNPSSHEAWLVLVHALWTVLLPAGVYDHVMAAGRNSAGLVIAALLLFPALGGALRHLLLACWTSPTLIWLVPVLRWAPWTAKL